MKNPFKVLGIATNATDEIVRKAWLEKVRCYPPETAPEQFKEISEAYEKINTRQKRIRDLLISTDCFIESPFEALTSTLLSPENRHPPTLDNFNKVVSKAFKATYNSNSRNKT
jgi:curved DNA-binding protein CbpA